MIIRKYEEKDLQQMIDIWNEVVEDGIAFPQEDFLDSASGKEFFESQSYTGGAEDDMLRLDRSNKLYWRSFFFRTVCYSVFS